MGRPRGERDGRGGVHSPVRFGSPFGLGQVAAHRERWCAGGGEPRSPSVDGLDLPSSSLDVIGSDAAQVEIAEITGEDITSVITPGPDEMSVTISASGSTPERGPQALDVYVSMFKEERATQVGLAVSSVQAVLDNQASATRAWIVEVDELLRSLDPDRRPWLAPTLSSGTSCSTNLPTSTRTEPPSLSTIGRARQRPSHPARPTDRPAWLAEEHRSRRSARSGWSAWPWSGSSCSSTAGSDPAGTSRGSRICRARLIPLPG